MNIDKCQQLALAAAESFLRCEGYFRVRFNSLQHLSASDYLHRGEQPVHYRAVIYFFIYLRQQINTHLYI